MGMFDWFDPQPALHCARCGAELTDWQGDYGPCDLVVWRQGVPAPTHHAVDEPYRFQRHELDRLRLPSVFRMYTSCSCKRWVNATGFCQDETWTETALGDVQTRASVPAMSFGDGVRQCSGCAHVWSIGDEMALAGCPACGELTELTEGPRDVRAAPP
jgi:hypothetical protein